MRCFLSLKRLFSVFTHTSLQQAFLHKHQWREMYQQIVSEIIILYYYYLSSHLKIGWTRKGVSDHNVGGRQRATFLFATTATCFIKAQNSTVLCHLLSVSHKDKVLSFVSLKGRCLFLHTLNYQMKSTENTQTVSSKWCTAPIKTASVVITDKLLSNHCSKWLPVVCFLRVCADLTTDSIKDRCVKRAPCLSKGKH